MVHVLLLIMFECQLLIKLVVAHRYSNLIANIFVMNVVSKSMVEEAAVVVVVDYEFSFLLIKVRLVRSMVKVLVYVEFVVEYVVELFDLNEIYLC